MSTSNEPRPTSTLILMGSIHLIQVGQKERTGKHRKANGDYVKLTDMPWKHRAACRSISDPNIFYDEHDPFPALMVCMSCPVRRECREYAMTNNELGIWGGTTYDERRRLRRKLQGKMPASEGGS
jgi:WhiB family transcriptional regulator, redox-sensing transcriptional regulator